MNNVLNFIRRVWDNPELTPQQSLRVQALAERLADGPRSQSGRDVCRDLEDAAELGLRKGFFAQNAQKVLSLTERGQEFILREAMPTASRRFAR